MMASRASQIEITFRLAVRELGRLNAHPINILEGHAKTTNTTVGGGTLHVV